MQFQIPNTMKNWRRSQWIQNKSTEYLELANFHKKDDPMGLNTLFVKIKHFYLWKNANLAQFSVLNLKISNSNSMKSWRRSQWIENKSREYLQGTNFLKKDNPKGLNT